MGVASAWINNSASNRVDQFPPQKIFPDYYASRLLIKKIAESADFVSRLVSFHRPAVDARLSLTFRGVLISDFSLSAWPADDLLANVPSHADN